MIYHVIALVICIILLVLYHILIFSDKYSKTIFNQYSFYSYLRIGDSSKLELLFYCISYLIGVFIILNISYLFPFLIILFTGYLIKKNN